MLIHIYEYGMIGIGPSPIPNYQNRMWHCLLPFLHVPSVSTHLLREKHSRFPSPRSVVSYLFRSTHFKFLQDKQTLFVLLVAWTVTSEQDIASDVWKHLWSHENDRDLYVEYSFHSFEAAGNRGDC